MRSPSLRVLAATYVAILGGGVLVFMALALKLGPDTLEGGGWLAAALLTLREVLAKIENIALGAKARPHDEHPLA